MADKVMFKLGPQTRIPANGTAVNGTFYLTSDTHRLYIGQGNNAVPINAGVTFCDNFAELTTKTTGETEQNLAGRVFFLKDTNILCVRSNGKWAQINSDTKLESAQVEVAKILNAGDGEGACVTIQVVDSVGKDVKAPFNIKPKTGNVKVYADKDGKTVEIGVNDGATYDLTSAEIKIKKKNENDPEGQEQEVTGEGASLVLTGSNSTTDKVDIHGAGSVRISNTTNGILVTGTDYTLESVTTSAQDEGFNVAVGINNGGSKNNTFFPKIKYGATPQTVNFIKDTADKNNKTGIATLDVYTKGEVDNLFSTADAMVFKDGIKELTSLPGNAKNGWTYKYTGSIVSMDDVKQNTNEPYTRIDSSAGWINAGDLFIASGTETNGILSGDWKWVHIPAGDDERYSLVKSEKGVGVALNVAGGLTDATAGDLVFNKDNWITLVDASANNTTTVTVGHKLVTDNASTDVTVSSTNTSDQVSAGPDGNTTLEIPVITPTVDAAGHITSLSQTTYKVIDSHNRLKKDETSLTVAGSNGTIKITPKIVMGDGETSVDANMAFSLKSESLTLTAIDKVITAELEWEQF